MALPITIPYTFANATSSIPLANLDSNFTTVVNAINGIGNGVNGLSNVLITGGTIYNTAMSNVVVGGIFGVSTTVGGTPNYGTAGQVLTSQGSSTPPVWAAAGGTGTVTSIIAGTGLSGGTITTTGTISITATGVSAATYGSASQVGVFTVNAQGQLTSASNTSIAIAASQITSGQLAIANGGTGTATPSLVAGTNITITGTWPNQTINSTGGGGGGGGTVTSITAGTGLSGGTITTTGTIAITATGVTAATYGSASQVGVFTVNAQGQITSASNTSISIAASQITSGILAIANGGTGITAFGTGVQSALGASVTGNGGIVLANASSLTNTSITTASVVSVGSGASTAKLLTSSYANNKGELALGTDTIGAYLIKESSSAGSNPDLIHISRGPLASPSMMFGINLNGALGFNPSLGYAPNYGTSGQVLTSSGSSGPPSWTTVTGYNGVSATTTSLTVDATYNQKTLEANSTGAIVITLPNTVASAVKIDVVQMGNGTVQFVAGTGASVNSRVGNTIYMSAQYSGATVYNNSAGNLAQWIVVGDVAPST